MAPASERPPSETEGKRELDILHRVFTNLPTLTAGYVRRPQLEDEVRAALMDDHHSIVTLVGRGGIGKTLLALAALRKVAETDRFEVIVWFSARDIDLMTSGAKPVQPRVLTDREIAEQYRNSWVARSTTRRSGRLSSWQSIYATAPLAPPFLYSTILKRSAAPLTYSVGLTPTSDPK